jgi:histidyl-tRNA synthetase
MKMKTNKNKQSNASTMSSIETPKGMKDYLPEEQIIRQELIDKLKNIFEKYGFSPLETPAMEMLSTFSAKGAGGSEVGKQIFTLTDRADRKLGLRFDFTVPMCRAFAQYQLPVPFKRYQIGNVWREEFGNRDREFIQCDVDVIGSSSPLADAEYLAMVQEFFDSVGLPIIIKINSRKFLDKIMSDAKIPEDKRMPLIMILDKLNKIGETAVIAEARKMGVDARKVLDKLRGDMPEDVKQVLRYAQQMGVKDAEFVPTLARGMDYYTGIIFEVYLKSRPTKLSVTSGGRFDKLVNLYCARDEPATGISFGLTRIYDALKEKQTEVRKTVTQVYVVPIDTEFECAKIAKQLRDAGIKTDISLMEERSIGKNLQYVDKMKIPYALIVGKDEIKQGKVKLKNMKDSKEWLTDIEGVIKELTSD